MIKFCLTIWLVTGLLIMAVTKQLEGIIIMVLAMGFIGVIEAIEKSKS